MSRYIVDRFEGEKAVCETENEEMVAIDSSLLPENVREGSVIVEENGTYSLDEPETQSRRERIARLLKRVVK